MKTSAILHLYFYQIHIKCAQVDTFCLTHPVQPTFKFFPSSAFAEFSRHCSLFLVMSTPRRKSATTKPSNFKCETLLTDVQNGKNRTVLTHYQNEDKTCLFTRLFKIINFKELLLVIDLPFIFLYIYSCTRAAQNTTFS